jgi:hypothetical protein
MKKLAPSLILCCTAALAQRSTFPNDSSKLANSTFGNLETASNGSIMYCVDCAATNPCTAGGSGAVAQRVHGAWVCSAGTATRMNFTQTGTGAVTRSAQSKLPDTLSILDFSGVDPTGTTDSTAGIQAILNRAASDGAAEITCPSTATFLITSMLTYQGASGKSFNFKGGSSGHATSGCTFLWAGNRGNSVLYLLGTKNVNISGLVIAAARTYSFRYGIWVDSTITKTATSSRISSISRSSGIISITTSTDHGLAVDEPVSISGVADTTYNGTFIVASVPTFNTLTVYLTGPNSSSSGGTVGLIHSGQNSYNFIQHSVISGSNTADIRIGRDSGSNPIDTIYMADNWLDAASASYGVYFVGSGNTKNFYLEGGGILNASQYGVYLNGPGGTLVIEKTFFSANGAGDIYASFSSQTVQAVESENTTGPFISSSNTNTNDCELTLTGSDWQGNVSNNVVIADQCNMTLIGNRFQNNYSGGSTLIHVPENNLSSVYPTRVTSIGNFYLNASGSYAPIYTNAGLSLFSGATTSTATSLNDLGGRDGSLLHFKNVVNADELRNITSLPNTALANPSMTINGVSCTLGLSCSVTASAGPVGTQSSGYTFANLPACATTVPSGTLLYCSDCKNFTDDATGTYDATAAASGHGNNELCENGVWRNH